MVSGVAVEAEDRVHGLDAGADAYLPKPIEPGELVAHARALLRIRQAGEALHKEREFLRAVLENVEDSIVACDDSGGITLLNRAARTMVGPAAEALAVEGWADRYPAYHPGELAPMAMEERPLYRALHGEHIHDVELVLSAGDGHQGTYLASGQPLFDAQGKKLGAVVAQHDSRRAS